MEFELKCLTDTLEVNFKCVSKAPELRTVLDFWTNVRTLVELSLEGICMY